MAGARLAVLRLASGFVEPGGAPSIGHDVARFHLFTNRRHGNRWASLCAFTRRRFGQRLRLVYDSPGYCHSLAFANGCIAVASARSSTRRGMCNFVDGLEKGPVAE